MLQQWIALNSRADWLFKLRISFAIHLRAICAEFAPENVVIFAWIDELSEIISLFKYIPLQLLASVSVASGGYLLSREAAR